MTAQTPAQQEAARLLLTDTRADALMKVVKWAADDHVAGRRKRAAFWTSVAAIILGDAPPEGAVLRGLFREYAPTHVTTIVVGSSIAANVALLATLVLG